MARDPTTPRRPAGTARTSCDPLSLRQERTDRALHTHRKVRTPDLDDASAGREPEPVAQRDDLWIDPRAVEVAEQISLLREHVARLRPC
jgi:hypothetical protein